jgi:hypothetical protein
MYLDQNGYFGPSSYSMNHARNADYSATAVEGGVLEMPVLFLAGRYDYVSDGDSRRWPGSVRDAERSPQGTRR